MLPPIEMQEKYIRALGLNFYDVKDRWHRGIFICLISRLKGNRA
jgi:hypothetical protein